jgi:hypothetical protein
MTGRLGSRLDPCTGWWQIRQMHIRRALVTRIESSEAPTAHLSQTGGDS